MNSWEFKNEDKDVVFYATPLFSIQSDEKNIRKKEKN